MTLPVFPTLPGQGFARKAPLSATNIATHDSGREARAAIYDGLYEFEVGFDGLASDGATYPGLASQSLQAIMGLYLQCSGGFAAFLYTDPTDNAVSSQPVAAGDGATSAFTLSRSVGAAQDSDIYVVSISSVAVNGVAASDWTLVEPNVLSFTTPPGSGAAIVASFSYAFVCRFLDDSIDFETMMQNLWAAKSVKFRSVRQ